jgi:hypothetical protein
MTRPEIIAALVTAGHTPTKALEIAIDVERGDRVALRWLHTLTRARP